MAKVKAAAWAGGLSGRLGDIYFADTIYGTQMRSLPRRKAKPTPGELAQRTRIARISALWNSLDRDMMLAWRAYAESFALESSGASRSGLSGYNLFSTLSTKRLQLWPDEPVPFLPPTGPFLGDAAVIGTQDGDGVVFTASQPNAEGVVTELFLQPLANAARKPRPKAYVSRGCFAFAPGELTTTVDAAPGAYACAYAFVREATGQSTALVPCGVVWVG